MTNATDEQALGTRFSLTRMIYSVSAAIIFFKVLEYCTWFLIWKQRRLPWKLSTLDAWFHAVNLGFVLAMLPLILVYSKRNLFRWPSSRPSFGLLRSISSGLLGGLIAFILLAPLLWYRGWYSEQLRFMQLLIAKSAVSPIAVFDLLLFVVGLSVTSEVVFRGVVFRTLTEYASMPAALVGSCLLFAYVCSYLGFTSALVLGAVSAILYHRARNLLAPIVAEIVFLGGGGALALWSDLTQR